MYAYKIFTKEFVSRSKHTNNIRILYKQAGKVARGHKKVKILKRATAHLVNPVFVL